MAQRYKVRLSGNWSVWLEPSEARSKIWHWFDDNISRRDELRCNLYRGRTYTSCLNTTDVTRYGEMVGNFTSDNEVSWFADAIYEEFIKVLSKRCSSHEQKSFVKAVPKGRSISVAMIQRYKEGA